MKSEAHRTVGSYIVARTNTLNTYSEWYDNSVLFCVYVVIILPVAVFFFNTTLNLIYIADLSSW